MNEKTFKTHTQNYLIRLKELIDQLDKDKIWKLVEICEQAKNNNNTIFLAGNGASASKILYSYDR